MKTKSKLSTYILRGSTTALLFSCVIVALCSAVNLPEQPRKAPSPQHNAVFGANAHQDPSLSFPERVAYQWAIEEVYWRHRIWPNTNAGHKPSLDAVMSQAQIEKKVEDYLRNSQTLEDYWQRPLTAEQLQGEMERMASHTKQPEVLRELFEALGNDPFIIAECLARPILSERLKRATVESRKAPLAAWVARAGNQMPKVMATASANYRLPVIAIRSDSSNPSVTCTDDTWTATNTTNAPSARAASGCLGLDVRCRTVEKPSEQSFSLDVPAERGHEDASGQTTPRRSSGTATGFVGSTEYERPLIWKAFRRRTRL